MEEYAEWEFKLSIPDGSGTTEREYLLKVQEQTGRTPEALMGPDFPELMVHVWSAFLYLSRCRGQGFSGPQPLSYQEIKAWAELTDTPLMAWEVDAIMRIDKVFMRVLHD